MKKSDKTGDLPASSHATTTMKTTTNIVDVVEPSLGRLADRDALAQLFDDDAARLVTIVGPGGMGKTHLATTFASSRLAQYSMEADGGGVWLCDLTSAKTTADICASIAASVFGHPFDKSATENMVDLARGIHRRGRTLLVLDNFEQLVAEAATAITTLLAHAPRLHLLVTSRIALDIPGEYRWPLSGLAVDTEAIDLFVRRAKQVRPDLKIDDEVRTTTIQSITTMLEGIPLAIELAAARTIILSLADICDRLSSNASEEVLVRSQSKNQRQGQGQGQSQRRHSSMRAVVAESVRLLDEPSKRALLACTVFEDGITLEAAEAVIGADDAASSLETLVVHSLVRSTANGRFSLYEVIREHAMTELDAAAPELRQEFTARHAKYFASLPSSAANRLELRNLLRAHEVLTSTGQRDGDGVRKELTLALALKIDPILRSRGLSATRVALLDRTIELVRDVDALIARGHAHAERGSFDAGKRDLDEAVDLAQKQQNRAAEALARIRLGSIIERRGDTESALLQFAKALECATTTANAVGVGAQHNPHPSLAEYSAAAHAALAHAYRREGRLEEAEAEVIRSITAYRALGNDDGLCDMVFEAGVLDLFRQRYETAAARFDEALEIALRTDARHREASIHAARGTMEQELGNIEAARDLYEKALTIYRDSGSVYAEASTLYYLGGAHLERGGQRDDAHATLTKALQLMRSVGVPRYEVLILGALAALRSLAGFEREATALFEEASVAAQACGREPTLLATLAIHRMSPTSPADVEAAKKLARDHACDDPRFALRMLLQRRAAAANPTTPRLAATTPLTVRMEARAFRLPDANDDVDLSRRLPLARILHALARSRITSPGDGLSVDDILAAGWPEERVRYSAGANRVYVALAELRKLGLRDWLLSDTTGYRLATSRAVVLEE